MRYKERFLFVCFFIFCFQIKGGAQDKPQVKLGGALRFNYNYSDWNSNNRKRGGDLGYDVLRLDVDASYKRLSLDLDYRFYPSSSGGGMLKHGFIGYDFNDHHNLKFGLAPVPFGLKPYTSNSYFFNINYYLGFEDDADLGVSYHYQDKHWGASLAFFKNADVLDFSSGREASPDRYGYDVGGRNKETNQLNGQVTYQFGTTWKQQLGVSGQLGGLYNLDTQEMGTSAAWALHYMVDYKHWNLKAQYTGYKMKPRNKVGESRESVAMIAYGLDYQMASEANTYSIALAYKIPINKGILDEICLYNDFSMMQKQTDGFNDSYQNVTGAMLTMGPIYTYVDWVAGKNQPWFGADWNTAFAEGIDSKWHTRVNVNVGYYF